MHFVSILYNFYGNINLMYIIKTICQIYFSVCPLVSSPKGIEYFKIYLETWGAIEMICPYHQIFVPSKCRCLPH